MVVSSVDFVYFGLVSLTLSIASQFAAKTKSRKPGWTERDRRESRKRKHAAEEEDSRFRQDFIKVIKSTLSDDSDHSERLVKLEKQSESTIQKLDEIKNLLASLAGRQAGVEVDK